MTAAIHQVFSDENVSRLTGPSKWQLRSWDRLGFFSNAKASPFVLGLLVASLIAICIPLRLGQSTRGQTEVL
jgi:hypothetical protein